MPNYEDRRYNAEMARREADGIIKRHGYTPQTMPHIQTLLDTADRYEKQNDREDMRRNEYENPHRTGRNDYPRQEYNDMESRRRNYTRSEMDNEEMRRSPRTGRYIRSEMDNENIYPSQPNNKPPYMRMEPDYRNDSPYMRSAGTKNEHKQKIGFVDNNEEKTKLLEMFEELGEYLHDYEKHKNLYKQSKSPEEKEHLRLEAEEMFEYFYEILNKIRQGFVTPEEKQFYQEMIQKLSMNK